VIVISSPKLFPEMVSVALGDASGVSSQRAVPASLGAASLPAGWLAAAWLAAG
jgi:hypothetical protein